MTISFLTRAARIAELIRDVVEDDQIVTHDPAVIDRRGAGPAGAVLVHPAPEIECAPGQIFTYTWTVFVLARPGRALDSLESIGATLDRLRTAGIEFDTAAPGAYTPTQDNPVDLPGYVLTIADPHINT